MEIRGLNGINKIENETKINKVNKKSTDIINNNDILEISEEAKQKADIARATQVIENTPDIRMEKINEVKQKLESGAYNNEEVINTVAEKLMKVLGF